MKKAVFLDRDGVINRAIVLNGVPSPPKKLSEVEILPGVKDAIKLLKEGSFVIVVVTNQPDVARGSISQQTVEAINEFLAYELGIEHFYTCFHDDQHGCACRKPKPGLLLNAGQDLNLNLQKSFMVGDRWRDVTAGQAAGCKSFFIDYGYEEKHPIFPFTRVSSLIEAAYRILENPDDTFS
jgi:D-glycero-D-manno-heptose 1,7-bisphosphate phosphatase